MASRRRATIGPMPAVDSALALAFVLAGGVVAVFALYLAGLAVAALFHPGARPAAGLPSTRVAVLVPAHNESELIERTIRSLLAQSYPSALFRVFVIADN